VRRVIWIFLRNSALNHLLEGREKTLGGPNDANVAIIDDDDTCMLLLPPLQTSEVATGLQLETYGRATNS
jgi:hypothetical protein